MAMEILLVHWHLRMVESAADRGKQGGPMVCPLEAT